MLVWLVVVVVSFSCRENNRHKTALVHPVTKIEKKPEKPLFRKSSLELQLEKAGLVNVCELDSSIRFDLKYAGKDNFTKSVLYDTLRSIYLQPEVAQKLIRAQGILKSKNPSLRLLVWDAARPMSVQRKMYAKVSGTPLHNYVADPTRTGLHNYGCAVDITICSTDGSLFDMGTPFDYFGKNAGILQEQRFVQQGILTKKQLENRQLLRKVMCEAGFLTVTGEWWHFNAFRLAGAKRRYALLN